MYTFYHPFGNLTFRDDNKMYVVLFFNTKIYTQII